ncbi:MAG: ABC transporter permease [Actinomycetia bacterium]|nr:ABC transporter permease [Actinomycetes bacterium]
MTNTPSNAERGSQHNMREVAVPRAGLGRVGARPTLARYFRRLWDCRGYLVYDARLSLGTRNRQNALGNVWLVLTPLLNGITYFIVFGLLLGTSRGVDNFIAFLTVGVFMFSFTSRTVSAGARSLTSNSTVVEAFNFPRIALPVSAMLKESLAYGITLITMIVFILVIPPLEVLSWRWVLLIPVVALQIILVTGVTLLLAPLVARFRDAAQLLPFTLRLWMYGSGVFYSFQRFDNVPWLVDLLTLNPMHLVLDISRNSLIYGVTPSAQDWLLLSAWSFGLLLLGILVFWKGDESHGRAVSR